MRWKCARFLWFYGARTKLNAVMEVSAKSSVINFEPLGHGESVHPLAWRFTGSIDELHIIIFISQVHSTKPVGCAYNWLMGSAINRVWPGTRPNSPKRLWPTWRRSTRGTDRRNNLQKPWQCLLTHHRKPPTNPKLTRCRSAHESYIWSATRIDDLLSAGMTSTKTIPHSLNASRELQCMEAEEALVWWWRGLVKSCSPVDTERIRRGRLQIIKC